jgi:hypothetical protein
MKDLRLFGEAEPTAVRARDPPPRGLDDDSSGRPEDGRRFRPNHSPGFSLGQATGVHNINRVNYSENSQLR